MNPPAIPPSTVPDVAPSRAVMASSPIPYGVDRPEWNPPAFQSLSALLVGSALVLGAIWAVRRRLGPARQRSTTAQLPAWLASWLRAPAGRQIEVMDRRAIGPSTQLVVVRYGQRQLLLSVSPQQCQCLRDEVWPASGSAAAADQPPSAS